MNRREFLTGTFLGLLIKPRSDYSLPKFRIGDYVRHEFIEDETERKFTYIGEVAGILDSTKSADRHSPCQWVYAVNVKLSNDPCRHIYDEWFDEDELVLIQKPQRCGISQGKDIPNCG